ncbi:ABC transporter substrate-binding protein [Halalkalibacter nanhaiisediminis]|uniref:Iron complex transport system substrate-binding protein n=1 Tax=Halalkalibacter nanhaiisediminis TaxID=688079 RepID=A0A562QPE0_9BACI|nr:ABC transporter substrate-binding protein [Halalkalibacter nanhaiisediminis]TWI58070.1 iron complex transport system substrate-binding protein [Halalkalibacter nanhaiisediminis]
MVRMKKNIGVYIGLFLLVLLLAACGGNNESAPTNEPAEATGEQEEIASEKVVQDAMTDELVIPANPERIIAPYLEDSLLALGITPAAQWSIGESVLDYLQPQLADVPKISWDLPLEQVVSFDPDLVMFSSASAIQNGLYEEYQKIAPSYVFTDEASNDWRLQLQTMGELLDKTAEADAALAEYDEKVVEAKEQINEAIGEESAAIIWVMNKQFYVVDETRFSGNVIYGDLEIQAPEFLASLPDTGDTWDPVTIEKLSELDADHIFLLNPEGEMGVDELFASSVWNDLPAVQADQVYEISDASNWTIIGLIASEQTIDEVVENLVK